jgi:hypothetical protein
MNKLFFLLVFLITLPILAQGPRKKTVSDLLEKNEPAWDLVKKWIKEADNKVEILPKENSKAEVELEKSQVSTKSPLGAVIYETGGILVDGGWIRILGSGSTKLKRGLMEWNKGKSYLKEIDQPSFLLIADDPIGGFYAINYGALGKNGYGKVFYFAPNTLQWESLDIGYSEFLMFCFSGDLKQFYKDLRWNDWKKDLATLGGDQGYQCTPDIWSKAASNINNLKRSVIPMQELWNVFFDDKK